MDQLIENPFSCIDVGNGPVIDISGELVYCRIDIFGSIHPGCIGDFLEKKYLVEIVVADKRSKEKRFIYSEFL